jgi:hypothetical protein
MEGVFFLDEADMYLQKYSNISFERNRLVAIFLRKFKYFDEVLFLIINLINQFDEIILNRIYFVIKYENLDKDIRRTISIYFLKRIKTDRKLSNFNNEDLNRLIEINPNDR